MLDDKGGLTKEPPSDEGQLGREILSPYAEVAHFLVVDRMLSQFGRRFFYMDTSRDLFDSAVLAMRDSVRRRRVEIVLYQHEKEGRKAVAHRAGKAADSGGIETRIRQGGCGFRRTSA